MDMTTLVESLGRACGIDLAFTEGRCTLRFDDAHEVTFEQDGDALLLHGVVGDDSRLADPVNLRLLLAASCLGAETDGGALSLWPRTGDVVLWKRYDAFTDYPAFERAVNAFLAQVIHWKGRLDALPAVASGGAGGAGGATGMPGASGPLPSGMIMV